MTLSNKSDGSASISLAKQHPMASWMRDISFIGTRRHQGLMFEFINHAIQVYETIREAQKSWSTLQSCRGGTGNLPNVEKKNV